MKHLLVLFILILFLFACSGPAANGRPNCNGTACVKPELEEPVLMNKPVKVTITVQSEKDIPGLKISLIPFPISSVSVLSNTSQQWQKDGISWVSDIKAKQPLTFTSQVRFDSEGRFQLYADIFSPPMASATDMVEIRMTSQTGKVYLLGTSIPITPGPLPMPDPAMRATIMAMPTATPLRTLTPFPITPVSPPMATFTPAGYPPPYP